MSWNGTSRRTSRMKRAARFKPGGLFSMSNFFVASDADGSFKNFYRGAAYSRHKLSAPLRALHVNVAWAPHLGALHDAEHLTGRQFPVTHEIRAEGPRRRARCRIFVEVPGKHAAREGLAAVAASEAIGHRAIFPQQSAQLVHVHLDFAEHRAAAQRHHQIEDARGDIFGFELRIEILWRDSQRRRERLLADFCGAEDCFLLGHRDTLRPAVLKIDFDRQDTCSRLLQDANDTFILGHDAELRPKSPRPDDRIAGPV